MLLNKSILVVRGENLNTHLPTTTKTFEGIGIFQRSFYTKSIVPFNVTWNSQSLKKSLLHFNLRVGSSQFGEVKQWKKISTTTTLRENEEDYEDEPKKGKKARSSKIVVIADPETVELNDKLAELVKFKKFGEAQTLYQESKVKGIRPDTTTINMALTSIAKTFPPNAEVMIDMIKEFRDSGILNHSSFSIAIEGLAEKKQTHIKEMVSLLETALFLNLKPNSTTFLKVLEIIGEEDSVEMMRVFEMMKAHGIKSTLTIYHAVLRVLSGKTSLEQVNDIIEQMKQDGIKPTLETFKLQRRVILRQKNNPLGLPRTQYIGYGRFKEEGMNDNPNDNVITNESKTDQESPLK